MTTSAVQNWNIKNVCGIGYGATHGECAGFDELDPCIEPLSYNTTKEEISGIHNGNIRI